MDENNANESFYKFILKNFLFAVIIGFIANTINSYFTLKQIKFSQQLEFQKYALSKRYECARKLSESLARNHVLATDIYYQLTNRQNRDDYKFTRNGEETLQYVKHQLEKAVDEFKELELIIGECMADLPSNEFKLFDEYLNDIKGVYTEVWKQVELLSNKSGDLKPLVAIHIGYCGEDWDCPNNLLICRIEKKRCEIINALNRLYPGLDN